MQTIWGKYIMENPPEGSEAYELKIVKGKRLPFIAVAAHQREALLKASKGTFYHKITDQPIFMGGRMRFNAQRPFDCFVLQKARAFVVVWFYVPRYEKIFYKIPIERFLQKEAEAVKYKSMTEEEVAEIGTPVKIIAS